MPNAEELLVEYNTSLYREVREFQTFIMVHTSSTKEDKGLIKDVHIPVEKKYAIWGRTRQIKTYELEKISGVYKAGSLILEFRMSIGSRIPQIGDYLELVGVIARQPRLRYLVQQILPESSVMIGRCLITPISDNPLKGT